MGIDDREIRFLTRVLTDPGITNEDFDREWVHFVCEILPRMDKEDIIDLGSYFEPYIGNSLVTNRHRRVLKNVVENCFPELGVVSSGYQTLKVGYALAETCKLFEPVDLDASVFENITTFDAAKELFAFMSIEGNRFLGIYMNYLDSKGVINVSSWNITNRWPAQLSLPSGQLPNVPPVYREPVSKYQLSEAAQARFPFLQGAIDRVSDNPALETVFPVLSKLASQVAREGQLTRHIALLGPPGVGKTESSRLLHQLLEAMNVCGSRFEEFSPGKNTEQYVDRMALEMRQLLQSMRAKGGLLLVDEAGKFYEGMNSNDPAAFRKRTLDVVFEQSDALLAAGVVVVFAGYRHAFEKVLEQDEGFQRRVLLLDIDPPSSQQLASHVWSKMASDGIALPPNFEANTKWLFDQMIEDSSMNFGYWATANNFSNALLDSATGDFLLTGNQTVEEITAEDFGRAAKDIGFNSSRVRELDFSTTTPADIEVGGNFDEEIRRFLEPPSGPEGNPGAPGRDL